MARHAARGAASGRTRHEPARVFVSGSLLAFAAPLGGEVAGKMPWLGGSSSHTARLHQTAACRDTVPKALREGAYIHPRRSVPQTAIRGTRGATAPASAVASTTEAH